MQSTEQIFFIGKEKNFNIGNFESDGLVFFLIEFSVKPLVFSYYLERN